MQTTTKPILLALVFAPLLLLEAFLLTPTPLNLHKCSPRAASFKQVYRTRPARPKQAYPRTYYGAHPIQHFYEKVIKVKADVAALLILVLGGFRYISTEKFALGSLWSDDWQLGRPTVPPVLSVLP